MSQVTLAAGAVCVLLGACSPAAGPPATKPNTVASAPSEAAIPVKPVKLYAGEIPLEPEGGTFVVPALINGQIVLKFTLDSGAADVSLPADVVSTLVRTGTITQDDFIGNRTFQLADGSTVPSAEFRIRSLKVGRLTIHNVTAAIADSRGSLLLGQSFLSRLSSWSINNSRHVLIASAEEGETGEPLPVTSGQNVAREDGKGEEPVLAATSTPSSAAASSASEAAATARMSAYLQAWSDPASPNGDTIRPFYAPLVSYYGQAKSADRVMAEKLLFASRWPDRLYEFVPGSVRVHCDVDQACAVSGVVRWSAQGAGGTRISSGTAEIFVHLRDGLIDYETSKVLTRE